MSEPRSYRCELQKLYREAAALFDHYKAVSSGLVEQAWVSPGDNQILLDYLEEITAIFDEAVTESEAGEDLADEV